MTTTTDRVLELRREIAELTADIVDASDAGKIMRLRSILRAKKAELQRLRVKLIG